MLNGPAELRRKAEACRDLADASDSPERKAHWIEQAAQWEAVAAKAEGKLDEPTLSTSGSAD